MTNAEGFKKVADEILRHRFEALRTLARLKALEAMVRHTVPKDGLLKWESDFESLHQKIFHDLLVSFEKQNPGYAASLDQREASETDAL